MAELREAPSLDAEQEQRLQQKLRLELNYNSNHIEGNTLTYGETELLLVKGKTHGSHPMREFEEMKAHDVALLHALDLADQGLPLAETDIRGLNKLLLKEPFWKPAVTATGEATQKQVFPGEYKSSPNNVRTSTGAVFFFASPTDTPPKMADFVEWLNRELSAPTLHPVELAAVAHHRFVLIHPFDDGNGRVARLIANYILRRAGFPLLVVKSAEKTAYFAALGAADAGDVAELVTFIAHQLEWSIELSLKAARGESLEEVSDIEKEVALFVRERLSGQPEVVKATPEAIRAFYFENIEPLLESYAQKMRSLSELFTETLVTASPDSTSSPLGDGSWKGRLANAVRASSSAELHLSVTVLFRAYKGKSRFDVSSQLMVQFVEFEVRIHAASGLISKLYSEMLLGPEREAISAAQLKAVFTQVKSHVPAEASA